MRTELRVSYLNLVFVGVASVFLILGYWRETFFYLGIISYFISASIVVMDSVMLELSNKEEKRRT